MLLGFTGNRFLVEENAQQVLAGRGLAVRELPRLSGEDIQEQALAPLLTPTLFGEAAVVLDFAGAKVNKELLERLASAEALVVVLDASAPPTRVKFYQSRGEHHPAPAPEKTADVTQWVTQRARHHHLKLEREAAAYLAEAFGADLASIDSELRKLGFLELRLDRETVARVVGRETPGDSFAMLGAATSGRPAQALAQLSRLLATGEDPFKLMGAVVWQYSLVARCVALLQEDRRATEQVAAARLSVKPYPAKKALEVARRLDEDRMRAQLGLIMEADLAMKSGLAPGLTLERLLVSLSL